MIKVFYCDVTKVKNDDLGLLMSKLPVFMQQEIRKYKHLVDQKTRLLARIMLLSALTQTRSQRLIHSWRKEYLGKPVINGWDFFNISHSGNYVMFCHGATRMGIDIEIKNDVNIDDLDSFIHPREKEYILNKSDIHSAFYDIWVKKESFLKATGQGLISDPNGYSMLEDSIKINRKTWYFQKLNMPANYISYLCSQFNNCTYELVKFDESMLYHFLRQ